MSPRVSAAQHALSRARILSAARGLVLRQGVERLSLRAVARKAGYSPASLYEYFAGKDEIVAALAADVTQRLDSAMATVRASGPSAQLIALALAYVGFAREHPEDFVLLFIRLPSARRSLEQPASGGAYGRVLAAAREGIASGAFRRETIAEELAYGLWALSHGMATLQSTHLRGFQADFGAADQRVIGTFVTSFES